MRNIQQLISEELLPRVDQPGQYVGLELNSRLSPGLAGGAYDVTIALAFPDTYGVGMSHLGSQVLYQLLNDMPGVACDRAYCPAFDAQAVMKQNNVPLFGWESRCALRDFDVLGFSLAYEMCNTNVLTMLDLAGIPLHTGERTGDDPIVIAGDAGADSPEPMADFIDLFLCGDGERPLQQLVELIRRMKAARADRQEILLEAARTIPSVYAPQFYAPATSGDLRPAAPLRDDVPAVVDRAHLPRLSDSPAITAPLVPLSQAVHERVMIEIMRGCPNGCRFCQAGYTRLPVRIRSIDEIITIARAALAASGYKEISLLSLSSSDYPNLETLIDRLNAEFAPQHVSISLPSLRVGSQLRILPKITSGVRKGGLTIAAEAGSDRLRCAIGKDITEANMLAGVRAAYEAGWRSVKVYFMAGLPGETDEDIDAIFHLCKRLSDTRREVDGQRGSISAAVSWFVPKPHTPMQWCAMRDAEYFWKVRNQLKDLAYRTPIMFRFHRIERSLLEAALCRGDRRMGRVIEAAWRRGARMDSWDEHFNFDTWQSAFAECGMDLGQIIHRPLEPDDPTPWNHIRCFRGTDWLKAQAAAMDDAAAPADKPPVENTPRDDAPAR